jgi:hypothetical protein
VAGLGVVDGSWKSLSKPLVPGRSGASEPPTASAQTVRLSAGPVGQAAAPAEVIDALRQLTQPLEIEAVRCGAGRKGYGGLRGVVGGAECDGRMAAIGQPHDDIRPRTVADTDDRQVLSAERVMRMRDGHASRRGWGRGGSALGMCPLSGIALLKKCSGCF